MDAQILMRTPARSERGVTLIEVIIAMVILTVVLLAMGSFAVNFTRGVRQSDARTIAVNLADQRLAEVRSSPNYSTLETTYNGTEATISGFTGYSRVTNIQLTGGPRPTNTQDYKTVTITVTAPGIATPIKKTIIVAAP
jgi:prepilin-type N-terminal cleavage/methylation domain-containing protein